VSDEWFDMQGHLWTNKKPANNDRCIRCGVEYGEWGPENRCDHRLAKTDAASPAEERWAVIEKWLRAKFEEDLARLKPKAIEYGASDLKIMGRAMEALLPEGSDLDHQSRERAGLEMACGFYAMGKAARLYGAWEKGREPSEDTWHDLGIYSWMARFIRDNGRWM
jgi:hypothetical protein